MSKQDVWLIWKSKIKAWKSKQLSQDNVLFLWEKLKIDMIDYINAMVVVFTTKLKPNNIIPEPATGYFFAVGKINKLREYKHQELHTVVT